MGSEEELSQLRFLNIREEADLSLEVILLIFLGIFMLIFGLLLFQIDIGALPYTPDSTYGLFLVIVSLQIITLGKTPIGDIRRSWILIIIGILTGSLGMIACFIPNYLSELIRLLVGFILFFGGIALLLQLIIPSNRAKTWIKTSRILQHLTIACGLVYTISILAGLITLFPGITSNLFTAVLLIIYGLSFFYLSLYIHRVSTKYTLEENNKTISKNEQSKYSLFKDANFPLSFALLIYLGFLLALLGILLFPVNLGTIPFSPDGQLGVLLVIISIQMMALGDTLMGQFKRSWLLISIGMIFSAMGIVSCIVPGILTGVIQLLVGSLNILGGFLLIFKRFLTYLKEPTTDNFPKKKELNITQTLLNLVAIIFGISTLVVGLISGFVVAGILIINGILIFILVRVLYQINKGNASNI